MELRYPGTPVSKSSSIQEFQYSRVPIFKSSSIQEFQYFSFSKTDTGFPLFQRRILDFRFSDEPVKEAPGGSSGGGWSWLNRFPCDNSTGFLRMVIPVLRWLYPSGRYTMIREWNRNPAAVPAGDKGTPVLRKSQAAFRSDCGSSGFCRGAFRIVLRDSHI